MALLGPKSGLDPMPGPLRLRPPPIEGPGDYFEVPLGMKG